MKELHACSWFVIIADMMGSLSGGGCNCDAEQLRRGDKSYVMCWNSLVTLLDHVGEARGDEDVECAVMPLHAV
jgi:hypothetical protein